jgi:putative glutamine amidotransferase
MGFKVGLTYSNPKKLQPYLDALHLVGLQAVPICAGDAETSHGLNGLDGLVVAGGGDINPALYGESRAQATEAPNDARDEMESRFLHDALALDVPVLCICRGLQMLNVAFGGSLQQDLAGHRQVGVSEVHTVEVHAGSRLAGAVGASSFAVNSRHHQAVERVAEELDVSARAPDGVVEGLEHPAKRFVVAVQWHPEDRVHTHACDRRLFEAFAAAVRKPR